MSGANGGPFSPGEVIFGKYEILRKIAEGGMGAVWLIRHTELDCERALKTITTRFANSPDLRTRFQREARVMASFSHPNAVVVHDARLTNDDLAYIEMEFVLGDSLDPLMAKNQPLPLPLALRLTEQLCGVLQEAHAKGIVHRDLKPSNLMLLAGRPEGKEYLKVLDFGLAKIMDNADTNLTGTGFLGTAAYASPEQITGNPVDNRSDLYSTGVLLFQFLTGHRPFNGPPMKLLFEHVHVAPPTFKAVDCDLEIPIEIEDVVRRCLAKDPALRPRSATELFERFQAAVGEAMRTSVPAPDMTPPPFAAPSARPYGPTPSAPYPTPTPSPAPAYAPEPSHVRVMAGGVDSSLIPGGLSPYGGIGSPTPNSSVSTPSSPWAPDPYELPQQQVVEEVSPYGPVEVPPDGDEVRRYLTRGTVMALAFAAGGDELIEACGDNSIGRWSIPQPQELIRQKIKGVLACCAFAPTGRKLLYGCNDNSVRYLDMTTGMELGRVEHHRDYICCVTISNNGKLAVSGSGDMTLRVWNLQTGHQVQRFSGHNSPVRCVIFSPDDTQVISGGEDRSIRVWDIETGEELARLDGHIDWVSVLAFTRDGSRLVSGGYDGHIMLWEAATGAPLKAITAHDGWVNGLVPLPDDRYLVSAGQDKLIRIWDTLTGRERHRFEGHIDWVTSLTGTQDGRFVASGGRDATVRVWRVPELAQPKDHHVSPAHADYLAHRPGLVAASVSGEAAKQPSFLKRLFGKKH